MVGGISGQAGGNLPPVHAESSNIRPRVASHSRRFMPAAFFHCVPTLRASTGLFKSDLEMEWMAWLMDFITDENTLIHHSHRGR
jgi:hypothetical protein